LAGADDPHVATMSFRQLALEPAVAREDVRPGVACSYYVGVWQRVPDFGSLVPVRQAPVTEVGIPDFARSENFGVALQGFLRVPRDGLYTLHLRSDDGSLLWMGGTPRIDNDGVHEKQNVQASMALAAGLHPLRIAYAQGRGDLALELWIEGPGITLQPVPPDMLWHVANHD